MKVELNSQGIGQGLDYIQKELERYGLGKKGIFDAMLAAEETMVNFVEHGDEQKEMTISVKKMLGSITIKIQASGEEINPAADMNMGIQLEMDETDSDAEMTIRNMVLHSLDDKIKYKYSNHKNTMLVFAKKHEKNALWFTVGALLLSIIAGFLLKMICPENVVTSLDGYFFTPVKTMFLNALKMVVGPVVFFSIVTCVANFGNLAELGKIGAKVIGLYMMTTVIAITVGISIFFLISPGNAGMVGTVTTQAAATADTKISVLDTVVGIVPTDIITPFLNANMLQIIFMALLSGSVVGMIGDYTKTLKDFFEACNVLFLKITTLIIKVIPVAVFCSMTSLIVKTGTDTLWSLLGLMGTIIVGMGCMVCVYCLLIAIFARINPFIFLKKYTPAMLTTFSLSSSSAAMPFNMQTCREKLGISNRVCSFSIPLGATLNMDGSCVYLAVAALCLAKVYGVSLTQQAVFSMIFSIFVLSVGAPGIPGSAFVCLSVLLVQIGVPVEAVSLIMGIDAILSMFRAASNTVGDAAVSLIVAKQENLLDMKVYKS